MTVAALVTFTIVGAVYAFAALAVFAFNVDTMRWRYATKEERARAAFNAKMAPVWPALVVLWFTGALKDIEKAETGWKR